MNGHVSNQSAQELDDYFEDWTVKQLDRDGSVSQAYTFVGCYPESVGAITLGHDQGNAIEEFEVTLQYQYWTHQGVTQR